MARKSNVDNANSNPSVDTKDTSNQKLVNVESPAPQSRVADVSNNTNVGQVKPNRPDESDETFKGFGEEIRKEREATESEALQRYLKHLGVKTEEPKAEVEVAKEPKAEDVLDAVKAEVDASVEDRPTDDSLKVEQEESAEKTVDAKVDEPAEEPKSEDSELDALAKEEGVDPSLANKDFAVKKLLKRVDTVTSKLKHLEAELARKEELLKSPAAKDDISVWTPERGEQTKTEYSEAINELTDILESEVEIDDNGYEKPFMFRGKPLTKAKAKEAIKLISSEMATVDSKVRANRELSAVEEQYEAKTYEVIPWYGDEKNPVFQEAVSIWEKIVKLGAQNVPGVKHLLARGLNDLAREHEGNKETPKQTAKIEIKKAEPKTTTPKVVSAPTPRVQEGKKSEVERLKAIYQKTNSPDDLMQLRIAENLMRMEGRKS
jgi:hypothetical protein